MVEKYCMYDWRGCLAISPLRKLAHAIQRDFLKIQLKNLDIFLIFAQNIDCGYTLEPPQLLVSTHNLCFGA